MTFGQKCRIHYPLEKIKALKQRGLWAKRQDKWHNSFGIFFRAIDDANQLRFWGKPVFVIHGFPGNCKYGCLDISTGYVHDDCDDHWMFYEEEMVSLNRDGTWDCCCKIEILNSRGCICGGR